LILRAAFRLSLLASIALPAAVLAQPIPGNSAPQPVPIVDTIPAARDIAYPGAMTLDVDATDIARGIFSVKQTIPVVQAGPMTLLYPQWLPGNHRPAGAIPNLAGLAFTADGKPVPWTRDPVDVYAFHIDVPAGAKAIVASFQFLSPTAGNQGRIQMTPEMLSLQWEDVSLYPAGYYTRQISVDASVTYPSGWTAASGLPSSKRGAAYRYATTNYETLVDSPVIAGKYYRAIPLTDRVTLDVLADDPRELAATPEQIEAHKNLVTQAVKLFGAQHYDNYHFLLTISDKLGGIGLEHHRSSEDGVDPGYFTKWSDGPGGRNLLPHEYTHSWNGKFRRGADLWTPDYRTPMRDSLLWVYEGQTQFWGYMLQARSGLVSKQDTLDGLAFIAAYYDNLPGREWRPLIDTTNDPIISARRPKPWSSYQRSEDYYNEGLLMWLDADSIIRKQSNGAKSMDDFAKAFFGIRDGDWGEVTYTFDDVVKTLDTVVPYDWAGFLKTHLYDTSKRAPLAGFTNNGYELTYTDQRSDYLKNREAVRKYVDLSYSLGLTTDNDGEVGSVIWNGPAFKQDIDSGTKIVAVNGKAFSSDGIRDAITAAKGKGPAVELLLKSGDLYRTVKIDYHGGLRYPTLKKTGTGTTGLDRLLAPK